MRTCMRTIRLIVPGVTYHLISRFIEKRWFLRDDVARDQYLTYLGRSLADSDWRCISYALMSSHVHLGMIAGTAPLETWAKRAHSPFASWLNLSLDRIGPVFVRGPKDHAVDNDRVPALVAYHHNNPVRAGVVERASDSTWTSHGAYLGTRRPPPWLDVEHGMSLGNFSSEADFDAWVNTAPEDPSRIDVGGIRRAARRGQIEFATPTGDGILPIVARASAIVRPDPRLFVQVTAALLGVPVISMVARVRANAIVAARGVAVHAALAFGVPGSDIGAALGLSVSAVSRIRHRELDDASRRVVEAVITCVRTQLNTVPRQR